MLTKAHLGLSNELKTGVLQHAAYQRSRRGLFHL